MKDTAHDSEDIYRLQGPTSNRVALKTNRQHHLCRMLLFVLIVRKELLYFCRRHYSHNSEDLTYINIYANINVSGGGVMGLVRWKNYSAYFFDEEGATIMSVISLIPSMKRIVRRPQEY